MKPYVDLKPKEVSRGVIIDFIMHHINKKQSYLWMWLFFLLEFFLIIPLDIVLALFCLRYRNHAFLLSISAAVCSSLSGLVGYFIGFYAFHCVSWIVFKFVSVATFEKFAAAYAAHEGLVVFVCSLLPLPFKAVTISAGIYKLSLLTFVSMVFFARVIRFLLISLITLQLEDKIFRIMEKYSYLLIVIGGMFLIAVCVWVLR